MTIHKIGDTRENPYFKPLVPNLIEEKTKNAAKQPFDFLSALSKDILAECLSYLTPASD